MLSRLEGTREYKPAERVRFRSKFPENIPLGLKAMLIELRLWHG